MTKTLKREKEEIMQKSKASLDHCFENQAFNMHSWYFKLQAIEQWLSFEPPPYRSFFDKEQDRAFIFDYKRYFTNLLPRNQ